MARSNSRDRREHIPAVTTLPHYFSRTEFNTCNPSCEPENCDSIALQKLDKLRELCGFPLMLTCAYRSVEHEKKHGRSGNSYHCAGRAFDIHCVDSVKRHKIVHEAAFAGFNGIGIYSTFIHVDDRESGTMWYGDK